MSKRPSESNAVVGGQTSFALHPNSAAALQWGRTTWSTRLPALEAAPRGRNGRPFYTTNEEARSVACPLCNAQLGHYCRGKRGLRLSAHDARHAAALAAGALPVGRKRKGPRNLSARDKR